MTLRLSVVSEHGIRLGAQSTKVFGVHGGTIGRGTDNEWILPDPERYLSGKHARIDFRAGSYVLVDTSSNGTYVNGAQVPLGKYHDYTLKDGDYVRLGEYELLVSIDQSNDFPPDKDAIVAYDGHSPSSAVGKSTANDLGADLDLSQLLEPSDQLDVDSAPRPRNSYGQPASPDRPPDPLAEEPATPWHMMTRPLKVEPRSAPPGAAGATPAAAARLGLSGSFPSIRAQQAPVLFDGDVEAGLTAFCRGAGIDPRSISPEGRGAALHLAGQLLRESVLGLMDLNQGRSELRNRFRVPPPKDDGFGVAPPRLAQRRRGRRSAPDHPIDPREFGGCHPGQLQGAQSPPRRHACCNAHRLRGLHRPGGAQGTGGALRSGRQEDACSAARTRPSTGTSTPKCTRAWHIGRRTGSRICSSKALPRPMRLNCAP